MLIWVNTINKDNNNAILHKNYVLVLFSLCTYENLVMKKKRCISIPTYFSDLPMLYVEDRNLQTSNNLLIATLIIIPVSIKYAIKYFINLGKN
jgi:hypothetical protein